MRRLLVLVLAGAPLLSACAPPDRLIVFAASSLAEVVQALAPDAHVNPGGSSALAAQIREGAPADVYISAAEGPARALHDDGSLGVPVRIARNRIAMIVPAANPARISGIADLSRPGVRIVMGAPGVPAGDAARGMLAELGVGAILRNVVSEEPSVVAVGGKVALGEADAGFVFATDVAALGARVHEIALPATASRSVVVAATVVDAAHPGAARAFLRLLTGPLGQRALRNAGFAPA